MDRQPHAPTVEDTPLGQPARIVEERLFTSAQHAPQRAVDLADALPQPQAFPEGPIALEVKDKGIYADIES